jgi:hypothetical protein
MKKVYLFVFIGILAIIMLVIELIGFNPKDENLSFTILGASIAIIILKLPSIIKWFKNKKNAQ